MSRWSNLGGRFTELDTFYIKNSQRFNTVTVVSSWTISSTRVKWRDSITSGKTVRSKDCPFDFHCSYPQNSHLTSSREWRRSNARAPRLLHSSVTVVGTTYTPGVTGINPRVRDRSDKGLMVTHPASRDPTSCRESPLLVYPSCLQVSHRSGEHVGLWEEVLNGMGYNSFLYVLPRFIFTVDSFLD